MRKNYQLTHLLFILVVIVALSFSFGVEVFAQTSSSSIGFVESSVWFDREPFFSDKKVRVYTALTNSSPSDFKGTVEFSVNGATIGSTLVSIERYGGYQVIWADWVPSYGDQQVSVAIVDSVVIDEHGVESAFSGSQPTYSVFRFVDADTDGDLIGNATDTDDDNDGLLDAVDPQPLVANQENDEEALKEKEDVLDTIKDAVASSTPMITATAKSLLGKLETFRTGASSDVDEYIATAKKEIEVQKLEEGEKNNDPFNQLKLLALTTAGYTLSHKIAFYLVLLFVAYLVLFKILPWGMRKIRGRDSDL